MKDLVLIIILLFASVVTAGTSIRGRWGGVNVIKGDSQGTLLFWDDILQAWAPTETNELFWDDTNKRLGEDTFLQTRVWADGDTWAVGDYCISDRKINVCNTAGAQSGTFASNSALWDELVTLADTPHNKLTSNDSYKNLLLTNSFLEYWDGTRQRIKIASTYSNLYSPDGGTLSIVNAGLFYENDRVQTEAHKGVNNGIAELDGSGIVPTSQLPGYVDAIVEYASLIALEAADPQEANKLYITIDDNKMYRYTGTAGSYGEISPTIVLGTTNTTAYRGDRGLIAYDHSQTTHYSHPTGDGNSHVPANSTTNDGKVLTASAVAGTYTWETPGGAGHDSDKIISPDTLKSLTVSDLNLLYSDGSYPRFYVDGTESRLTSPDGQSLLQVKDADFNFNDGTRDRIEADGIGTTLRSTTGAYLSMLSNTLLINDNTRNRLEIDASVTTLRGSTGADLILADTWLAFNDATRTRLNISSANAALYSPDGSKYLNITNTASTFIGAMTVNAYTKIGSGAPAIKMKKLTGTTPAVEGNSVSIAHGLTGSKILAVDVLVGYSSNVNNGMPPGYIRATGYEYYSYHTSSGVVVFLSATNSERILSDTIRILITYEE